MQECTHSDVMVEILIYTLTFSDLVCQLMILYGTTAYLLFLVLIVTEMVVMKTLYIFRFSRIAAMNEN